MKSITELFQSSEFKIRDHENRKELIGNAIYETVELLSGQEYAPKITGMLIALPPQELYPTFQSFEVFQQKIQIAQNLLNTQTTNNDSTLAPNQRVAA